MATLRNPRINNMSLNHTRRDPMYESIMTDLVLMGALDKEVVESFTGTRIADTLKPPAAFTALLEKENESGTDE